MEPKPLIDAFFDEATYTVTYLVTEPHGRRAGIVDPVLDYDPDIAVPIKAAGAKALAPNLWPLFSRLAKARPVLLVRGETSDLLSPAIVAKMQKRAPKMDVVEVPGVGHAPMLDEAEAKAAIFPFLSELP